MYRILGASHFFFYNHTIGPQVQCIINDYIANGLISVHPWRLNILSQKEIRTEGLFAALNDCVYRTMNRFSHTLIVDLDEYVLPKRADTLQELLE